MLWFIGTGISGYGSIPLKALEIIKGADIIYLEQFTSPADSKQQQQQIEQIKKDATGQFKIAKRWLVEDGTEIIKNAKEKVCVLLSYGDPYIATTHIELRCRAIKQKIKTGTIHAASSITAMVGQCGLHYYKIGRIATIMDDPKSMTTPYYVVYKNMIEKNHSVLLLEYNQDQNFFLEPQTALKYLVDTEEGQKRKVITQDTFGIIASRVGYEDQKIVSGTIAQLLEQKNGFGRPPHTIIIPGSLHFTETEALLTLTSCIDTKTLQQNDGCIKTAQKISAQMIEKYVPMVRESLAEIKPHYKDSAEFAVVIQNAELYIKDAEQFLQDGKDEVAVLCIGYADGLVDALRMAKGMEPSNNNNNNKTCNN